MNVLAISHPILIRFECSWALFKAGGYRNAYPYPYPSLPVVLTRAGLKTRGVHYRGRGLAVFFIITTGCGFTAGTFLL